MSKCNSKNRCRGCHQKHHTSLCQEINNRQSKRQEQTKITPQDNSEEQKTQHIDPSKANSSATQVQNANATLANISSSDQTNSVTGLQTSLSKNFGKQTILKTAINSVHSRTNSATAHILFDEGAQRSFITQDLADKLDLVPENSETLNLSVFGGSTTSVKQVGITTVYLHADNGDKIPVQVIIIPTIAAPQKNFLTADVQQLPHLNGLKLAHPITSKDQFQISLLIGADHYWDIVENEIIRGPGPTAAKSKIGYLLSGPMKSTVSTSSALNANILKVIVSNEPENTALEKFWNLESIGILPDKPPTDESKFVQEYQDSSIRLLNGQYCAKLPWKVNHAPLPTNEAITRGRTRSTVRRLSKDPKTLAAYNEIINEQLKRDFIERVTDPQTANNPCHYIPHHPVFKDSSTTPLRIVYDCSCTPNADQPSLNSCLSTGPDILNDMTASLVRFRCYQYGVTADIEKAFLNISLDAKDRDATRFLWLSDPTDPESKFDVYRFKSVLFGASCSPFILNATIKKHLDSSDDPVAQRLKADIYVDNLASGTDNEDEALQYITKARSIMSPVKFNLRSWNSNSPKLQRLATDENIQDKDIETKVLGLRWNAKDDTLKLQERHAHSTINTITKREVLRESSKIYDPLGLLTPVTIRAKIFIQELWEQGYTWDELLPENAQKKWIQLSRDLESATRLQIQRRYFPLLDAWPSNVTLHVFVDASIKAYGTAAYVTSGSYSTLVMSKSRVAP